MRVLDVGCGAGDTTITFAERIGPEGAAHGVDISSDLVTIAEKRAARTDPRIRFFEADAQIFPFEPHAYDLIASRFGVMFFNDAQAAFRNLAQATHPEGRFVGLVWRAAEDNPFMTAAERAAAPLIADLSPRIGAAAGQFGFADADHYVVPLLRSAGWRDVDCLAVDTPCAMSMDDLAIFATRLGPVGRRLANLSEAKRQAVIDAVMPAYDPFVDGGMVRFNAACWLIKARPATP